MDLALSMLGLGQAYLAELWDVSRQAIGKKLKGNSDISYSQAIALQNDKGINANWLLTGEGEMYLNVIAEPAVSYNSRIDVSDITITKRFVGLLDVWQSNNAGILKKDIAEKIGVKESHLSQLRSGAKTVTVTMLANAVVNMGIDANMVLAMKTTGADEGLKVENERLREENENQKLLLRSLKLQLGLNAADEKKSA